jgi:hypothetical protein
MWKLFRQKINPKKGYESFGITAAFQDLLGSEFVTCAKCQSTPVGSDR